MAAHTTPIDLQRRWSAVPARPFFSCWPALLFPGCNRSLIALACLLDGLLPTLLEATKEATGMSTMRADTELLPDHLHYPRCRPDLPSKSEGFRSSRQQAGQLRHVFGAQLRFPAGRRLMSQGLDSLCFRFLEPLTDCALAHSKCGCDVFLFPSGFTQFPGTHPSSFAPILWRYRVLVHTSFHRHFAFVLSFFQLRSIGQIAMSRRRCAWVFP